jgi:hypothetical protein
MKKLLSFAFAGLVTAANAQTGTFPSSSGHVEGDHLQFTSDVYGLIPTAPDATGVRCAGKYSAYAVDKTTLDDTYITFYFVNLPAGSDTCPKDAKMASEASQYRLANKTYDTLGYKSTGIAFGALVVPFKFRLGNDKKLVSSTTIAPYLGARMSRFQGLGVQLVPVITAGLALVPVSDPVAKTTETKAAFSTAVGLTLTSSKNADFNAGVLIGKDFLGKSDRAIDNSVTKPWISIWIGVSK